MKRNIKISIIVPVYDSAEYLRRCLDSCVYQTMREIEVVVVWDCSPDPRDKQVIQEYERQYPDLINGVFNKENLGPGESRNCGIRIARGRFLMFCDSDDYLAADACERMHDVASLENADLVFCDYYYMRDGVIGSRIINAGIESVLHENRPLYLSKSTIWVIMIEKTLIEKNELFFLPCRFGEDNITVLWYLAAHRIAKANLPLYYYVYRKSSLIGSMTDRAAADLADAYICLLGCKYYSALENDVKHSVCFSIFKRFFGYWIEYTYSLPGAGFKELFKRLCDIMSYCAGFYEITDRLPKSKWEAARICEMLRFAEENNNSSCFDDLFRNFYAELDIKITDRAFQALRSYLSGKFVVLWAAGSYGRIHGECLKNAGIDFEVTDINAASLGYRSWDELKDTTDIVLVSSSEFAKVVAEIVAARNTSIGYIYKPDIEVLDLQSYLNEC